MNICQVITRLIVGGAQENTILTCKGLVDRGHQVQLLTGRETGPEGSLWSDAERSGCILVPIDALRRSVHPVRDVLALHALRRALEDFAPDVVHTHSSKAGILGREAAFRVGVPIIVHSIHGMSFNRTQRPLTRWFFQSLERRAARQTTMFIAVAEAMASQMILAGMTSADRCRVIPSGMDTELFRPDPNHRRSYRSQWGVTESQVVIGTVARLFPNKGYEDLLVALPRVVARIPEARFVWIGAGPHQTRYARGVAQLGLQDRVRFAGLMTPSEVAAALNGFDVLVHASQWEGLPRAVVQALLCEVPVVCYNVDGAPEVVLDQVTGVLVPLAAVDRLADAMADLAADRERRRALGREGRTRVRDRFDWRRMVDEILDVYGQCAKIGAR